MGFVAIARTATGAVRAVLNRWNRPPLARIDEAHPPHILGPFQRAGMTRLYAPLHLKDDPLN